MAVDPRRQDPRVIAEKIAGGHDQVRDPSRRDRAEPISNAEHFRRRRRQRGERRLLAQSASHREAQPRPKILLRFLEFLCG